MYRSLLPTLSGIIAILLLAAPLRGQDASVAGTTLPRGARVRVSAPNIPARFEARLDAIRDDTLHLNAGTTGYAVAVPLIGVRRIEIPDGEASRAPRALIGTGMGVVPGAVLGYQTALLLQKLYPDCAKCEYEPLPRERQEWLEEDRKLRWVWAAGIGAAAGIAGGILGYRRNPGEAWRDVSLPVRVAVAPAHGGIGVGVGLVLMTR